METGQTLAESRQLEVREELKRLLESAPFRTSKRCKEFLRHVVEKTVGGPTGSLKERSIGVELFGLPNDFDTSQHPVVRVTAGETRKKLALYYQGANGRSHPVKIDLPPGSYVAEFTWNELPEPAVEQPIAEADQKVLVSETHDHSRRWIVGAVAASLAIAGLSTWRWRSSLLPAPRQPASSAPTVLPSEDGVRIGSGLTNPYLDRNGQTWGEDQFFTGGLVLSRSSERIVRTLDPDLYRHLRSGDFRYDIPLAPGNYEMHLHFAETGLADFISAESSGEGQRVFRVTANGKLLLDSFDVVADAEGANIADERVFREISPSDDGILHLIFSPQRGSAMVSAIELLPVSVGNVLPLRIRCGWPTSWRDAAGAQWHADSYFLGGNALVRRTNPARESETIAPDSALYESERWGHFSYALPVAEGRYRVLLKFCEGHLGARNAGPGGVGSRVFDIFCNGVALVRDFDIVKEAGGEGRPLNREFSGIRPNAQGKILLSFVPTKGMACVNGIEVVL